VIVSSFEAVYKESVRELQKNIDFGDLALKTLVKRISTADFIGSYFVSNKFELNTNRNQRNG
jgi:transposase